MSADRQPVGANLNRRAAIVDAILSRALAVVAAAGSILLLPLTLQAEQVGQFFQIQTFAIALALLCQFGFAFTLSGVVSRLVAIGELGSARRYSLRAICFVTGLGGSLSLLGFFSASIWWPTEGDPVLLVMSVAALAPLIASSNVIIEVLRAIHRTRFAVIVSAAVALPLPVAAFGFAVLQEAPDLGTVVVIAVCATAASVLIGFSLFWRATRPWHNSASAQDKSLVTMVSESSASLGSSLSLFFLAQFDLLLISVAGTDAQIAIYAVASRGAVLLLLPLAAANLMVGPAAAHARATGRLNSLQILLRNIAVVSSGLALAGLVAAALLGQQIINQMNPAFADAYPLLLILGAGQVVHASCGSSGMLLMTGGAQGSAMRISLLTGACTVVAAIGLFQVLGLIGLAGAMAAGNAAQTVAFAFRASSRFKVNPTVLSILRVRRPALT